jgi:hypothetical protein
MTGTSTSQANRTTTKKSPCGCTDSVTPASNDCGCGCQETGTPCCTNVCFERPNYFCGHLLTDDDLTTGLRYAREKNKLYHRTLHGSGIVCGLGLRRDLDCPSQILVGEGFAIDFCGNDLVVCEQQSFNVISALRKKGYLVSATADPCKEAEEQDCSMKQCFWIAARYVEKQTDFESPLESACSPGPLSCEPTRIQEAVEFDVLDQLPSSPSAIDQLIARVDCCFRLLTEGNFANTVKANTPALRRLFEMEAKDATELSRDTYFNIFCQLKAYFLQHIRKYPDPYDAQLENDVQALAAPTSAAGDETKAGQVTPDVAICRLFGRVWSYLADCLYSAMVFPCPAPKCGGAVVLGTVEIENGKLARICNCGRSYVWSAANFWQVLVAYLVQTATCESANTVLANQDGTATAPAAIPTSGHCCPEIDLSCNKFFSLYLTDQKAPQAAVHDTLGLLPSFAAATKKAFNFMDPNVVDPKVFLNMSPTDAQALSSKLGLTLQLSQDTQANTFATPFAALMAQMLVRPGDTVTATVTNDKVVPLLLSDATLDAKATAIGARVDDTQKAVQAATTQIEQLSATAAKATDLASANAQIQQLTTDLKARDATLATLNEQFTALTSRVAVLEKLPAAGAQGD